MYNIIAGYYVHWVFSIESNKEDWRISEKLVDTFAVTARK